MLNTLLLSVVCLAAPPTVPYVAAPNSLTPWELPDGWISLFDGESLYGWEAGSKANWKAEGGVISVSSGEPGLLCTTIEFGDYILKVDFRSHKGTNSGVFLHTPLVPKDPANDCYELNIADPSISPFPTGSFVKRQKATGTYDSSEWKTFEVTVQGGHVVVKVDGQQALDYTDPKPLGRGRIGLQLNSGPVEFRNIKLKPLGLKSIFNGRDLTGWKPFPDQASKFTVTPAGVAVVKNGRPDGSTEKPVYKYVTEVGEINVKNGRGQLESEGQYGDFVLQFQVYSNGKHLNSGVFFRSIPGEFSNGYECQIQNGYKDHDRTKPIDCGTGGFYRRQDARKVLTDDFEWNSITLAVSGKHMAAWANGIQVSDWTDPREPNDNPRKGLRLAPGTLILQGHDPTTDLSFRKLNVVELPKK